MDYFINFYLIGLMLIFYNRTKNILHPACITSFIWVVLVTCYIWIDHGLYKIHLNTYFAVAVWVTIFCMFSYWSSIIKLPNIKWLNYREINPFFLKKNILFLCGLLMVCLIFLQFKIGINANADNVIAGMRESLLDKEVEMPLYYRILNRGETFIYVLFWGIVLTNNQFHRQAIFILGTLLLIYTFLLATKGKILELFLVFFAIGIFNHNIKIKYIIYGIFIIIPLIFIIAFNRDSSDYSILELLVMYTLSPLTALDIGLNYSAFNPSGDMSNTFKLVYTISESFNLGITPSITGNAIDGWQTVPIPTNVYTIIYPSYKDFGWGGIVLMATLMGMFWGIIFNFSKRNIRPFKLMYSIMYYMLIFQFFGDWFFAMLSMNIQIIFYSILIFLKFKNPFVIPRHD